jgi:aryl-alcohol dehydrogenase-like predicted oxidoreductase
METRRAKRDMKIKDRHLGTWKWKRKRGGKMKKSNNQSMLHACVEMSW